MPSLEGKSAVVTGASSGIGAATALTLTREGARVVGGARRVDRIPSPITGLELDVTDPASCERFVGRSRGRARRHRHPRQRRGARARPGSVRREQRSGRANGARDERERPDPHDAPLPCRTCVTVATSSTSARLRVDRRTRRAPLRRRPSSPCAASRTPCAKTCSAGRSTSPRSTPVSWRQTSRACASAATRRPRARSTRVSRRCSPRTLPSASSSPSLDRRT